MPSPVPAGYTRGPIIFLGGADEVDEARVAGALLQRFWQEAGAYGSRIVVLACGAEAIHEAEAIAAEVRELECQVTEVVRVANRADAQDSANCASVQGATGVLLVGASGMRVVGILGGTLMAQTLRRMNAQSKVVAASGSGAAALCQHLIGQEAARAAMLPLVHRERIHFAPGLGTINRLVVECGVTNEGSMGRLLTAVGYNPFLTGMSLAPGTGAALYANGILEVFGEGIVLLVDGSRLTHTSLHESEGSHPACMLGVQLHLLTQGGTYSIDTHEATAANPEDVEMQSGAVRAAF